MEWRSGLEWQRHDGMAPNSEQLDVWSADSNLNDLDIFVDLLDRIKKKCCASVVKEAGSAIFEEWLVFLESNGRRVSAKWDWTGIDFFAEDEAGREFLSEIEDVLRAAKYWKLPRWLRLFF
ncbi:hypothetical protein [Geomonas anaerohicana]|uniref:Uncharacterized protein n=1 Tax=Geomonas anaerohicana TaxID=2798583 RepID=A0ABS0YFH7_9BACT|nr:hypothetical protein [Geomonas anaerohicana]MBJ6751065.1 hypothetical protein [Geomonas anaerohicana]